MPSYLPSQTAALTPLNPTVSVSGIYLATKRAEPFAGRAWGKSQYEDFCWGPQFLGQQEFQYKSEWSIRIDKSNASIFSEKNQPSLPKIKRYTDGLLRYGWGDVSSVSMDFDEIGLPCVSFERSGACNIRRLIDGVLFKLQFSGASPKILSNNTLQPDTASRDLICFYVDTGILKYRIQRDNFSTAYQPFSGSSIKFEKIYSVFADKANYKYSVYAKGLDGFDYKLDSLNYPASPISELDMANMAMYVYSGSLFDVVSDIGIFGEQPHSSVGLAAFTIGGGGYRPVLNDIGIFGEQPNSKVEVASFSVGVGGYRLVLNDIGIFGEQPHSQVNVADFSINGGSYYQVAFPFTYMDSGDISFTILSGRIN